MTTPNVTGEPITAGVLFRLVPNWETHWEYDYDRPSPRAFRRRAGEEFVSMYHGAHTTQAALEALFPDFAVCALPVEKLLENAEIHVVYQPEADEPEGAAHVAVHGVNRNRAQWLAREGARVVKRPGPPARPKVEGDDQPRDRRPAT